MKASFGRRVRGTAMAAVLSLAASGAAAQAPQPFAAAVPTAEEIRSAFVSALSQPDGIARAAALDDLADTMRRLAATDSTTARAVRTELAEEGVLADVVLLMAVESHLSAMNSDPRQEITAVDLVLAISGPARQTAAWLLIADAATSAGHIERAAGVVGRAIETALKIEGIDRIAAIRAISDRVAAFPPAQSRRYLPVLLGAVPDARARTGIVSTIVRPLDAGDAAPTVPDALARLEAGSLWPAIERLVAINLPSDSDEAKDVRNTFLTAALAARDIDAVLAIASSVDDRSEQDDLLARAVAFFVKQEQGLKAYGVASLLVDGADRARALIDVADRLRSAGYDTAALGVMRQALPAAESVEDQSRRNSVLATLGRKFALYDPDGAEAIAAGLTEEADRNRVRSAIAKATADRGDPDAALAIVRTLKSPEDRSAPIAAIARQRARAGDIAGANGLLAEVGNPKDRNRALSAIAIAHAKAGNDANALATAAAITDPVDSAEAYIAIHAAAKREDRPSAADAFERARSIALHTDDSAVRNAVLSELAVALADEGSFDEASAIAAQITEADDLDRLQGEIVTRRVKAGDLKAAAAAADTITDIEARERALADIAVRRAADGDLAGGLAAVRPLSIDQVRVQAFRRIAERQARSIDRIGALDGPADAADPPPPPDLSAGTPVEEDSRMRLSSIEGRRLPSITSLPLPDVSGVTVAKLRQEMPAPNANRTAADGKGDVEVTPLRYSKFNFKFLQEANVEGQSIQVGVQGDLSPSFINVDRGVFTLSQVRDQLVADGRWDAVEESGGTILFRLPILVGSDATLIISGEEFEELRLGSDTGAYLVVAGTLYVLDTRLVAYSEKKHGPEHWELERSRDFRPFIVGWSNSKMFVGASTIVSIGYPAGKGYGLAFTAGPTDLVSTQATTEAATGVVVDNTFEDALYGFYSYEAEHVDVVGNEYRNNIVYGIDPHDRSQDLRIAFNTIYGTKKKHGLIISREVDYSFLIGNLSFDNKGSGIMLDRDSVSNIIYANTAFDNHQDGLTFFESSCNLVMANDFFDNSRSGIRVRNSWDVALYDNRIADNGGSGIDGYVADLPGSPAGASRDYELDPYVPITTFFAEGNTLDANSVGATLRGVTSARFAGNVFTNHRNRIFRGDIAQSTTTILQQNGLDGVRITAQCRPRKPEGVCTLRERGYLPADDSQIIFDPEATGDCTNVEGSLQRDAFLASVPRPAGSAEPSEDAASPAADEPTN